MKLIVRFAILSGAAVHVDARRMTAELKDTFIDVADSRLDVEQDKELDAVSRLEARRTRQHSENNSSLDATVSGKKPDNNGSSDVDKKGRPMTTCKSMGCNEDFLDEFGCQCNGECNTYRNCCEDFHDVCVSDGDMPTPVPFDDTSTCAEMGCDVAYDPNRKCQCGDVCHKYDNCCADHSTVCHAHTVTTTTPKPTRKPVNPGNEAAALADKMNDRFYGFDTHDDSSPLGVTITMHHRFDVFCKSPCYQGFADCRMSASIYNHQVMLDRIKGSAIMTMSRSTGFVFNQNLVESTLSKCSYMFDGATFNRYNKACGCNAAGNCDNPQSAYGNTCKSTGKTCKVADVEIDKCTCDSMSVIPGKTTDVQCVFKGPAFDDQNNTVQNHQLRWMLKERVKHQDPSAFEAGNDAHDPLQYWNEVVIDLELVMPLLAKDAASVIDAFVYKKGSSSAKKRALKMRDALVATYPVSKTIPLIAMNTQVDIYKLDEDLFSAE